MFVHRSSLKTQREKREKEWGREKFVLSLPPVIIFVREEGVLGGFILSRISASSDNSLTRCGTNSLVYAILSPVSFVCLEQIVSDFFRGVSDSNLKLEQTVGDTTTSYRLGSRWVVRLTATSQNGNDDPTAVCVCERRKVPSAIRGSLWLTFSSSLTNYSFNNGLAHVSLFLSFNGLLVTNDERAVLECERYFVVN